MADNDWDQTDQDQPAVAPRTVPADEAQLQSWIAAIVDQDQSALERLYDCLVEQVYGLALRITGRAQIAEEVAQDTFWQVWRQAPRFDPARGSVRAWVMTMARSRALDALRQLDSKQTELEEETLAALAAPAAQRPADLLGAVQQGHLLHAALAQLEPLPRQLLALAFFRGLSHDEIAESCGLPLGTVKSHIRRALQSMQHLLTADFGEVDRTDE
ncbi:sigma-70 family RNA polymerase sigma factor [Methylomonas koyamae]|uniref:RNA polymerase subunit sigma-24 n=1 Tax=Methylomonas koyamae TaxID=702114 RepID=A0A291II00_9GAMM|nr:sigma-70 family RNA polymerase sigma factor [Methylomonas koyamae]ATG89787.1 ECF subfamily RNA polymerase sigma-24 subunit [Methylomonas koyamae]OAI21987.1 RNA polymerase subunit sigma-24 [Methylomonas koyamae]